MGDSKDNKLITEVEAEVCAIPIIDTHEHLISEQERRNLDLDIFFLFSHYTSTDLINSGMSEEEYFSLSDFGITEDKRWRIFEKYWQIIKNTNYSKIVLESVKALYGFDDINAANHAEISKKINDTKNIEWYDHVLSDRSRIKYILNFIENIPEISDTSPLKRSDTMPVKNFVDIISVCCKEDLMRFEKKYDTTLYNLKDYLDLIDSLFEESVNNNYRAIKIVLAYMRDIHFEEIDFGEADKVFSRLYKLRDYGFLEKKDFLSKNELGPLQDHLVHYIIQKAISYNLPIQIHSGLLDGNLGNISGTNPNYLINLFLKYRNAKFDIFHAGYPYSDILVSICKQFPNVYFNLCWIHDVSADLYGDILERVCEILPSNKVFGFGGDYKLVECIYGAQKTARKTITTLLYKKIRSRYFTFEEGIEYAKKILYKNPLAFYSLN
ncbi:MAG: amidohydrolase family protein [Candidatus Humimicrobiaceae bacterium]